MTTSDATPKKESLSPGSDQASRPSSGGPALSTTPSPRPIYKPSETSLLQITEVKLAALRALSAILGHNHYLELLLVPKTKSHQQDEASCSAAGVSHDAGQLELQESSRLAMKQLVGRAVQRMPISRAVTAGDLERAMTMLHHTAVISQAENIAGLQSKKGEQLSKNFVISSQNR